MLDFPTFAINCDRRRISDRAAASLSRAILQDSGLITPTDKSQVEPKQSKASTKTRYQMVKVLGPPDNAVSL
jgi:hypothetical protein